MSTCPNTGVRDFPIKTTVNITDAFLTSIAESFLINLQWGQRSTAPTLTPQGMLQEGSSISSSASTTTLRLQGNSYTLFSAQLCAPTHKDFLKSEDKPLVKAEFFLVFKTSSDIAEKYVIICVPILEAATTTPNVYVEALLRGRLPGGPISLGSFLPEPKQQDFFSYTTCLSQVTAQQTVATQVRVLLFFRGTRHSNVDGLLRRFVPRGVLNAFPTFILPDQLRATTMPSPFMLDNETVFGRFIRAGNLQRDLYGRTGEFREDTTSAYKCVPLNPDTQITDGKIKVNTEHGTLLSKVLEDRSADLNADLGKKGMNAEDLERMMAIALGITIGLLILMIAAYFISRVTASPSSYAPGPVVVLPSWIRTATPTMFISVLVGILGFIVGSLVVYYAK